MQRIAVLLVVAGCRLHFDDRPPDAAPADAAPPRLVCNTPLRLADAPNAPYVSTTVIGTRLITSWVDGAGTAGGWKIDFTTPDTVMTTVVNVANDTGYDRVAGAATASVLITAFTRGGSSYIDLLDRDFMAVAPETTTSVTVLGPAAAAVTGTASGPIGAVAGNSMLTGQGAIVPVLGDGTLGTPIAIAATYGAASLVNVGDRIAFVGATTANNCAVSTVDLAVTARATATGWGTAAQCSQAILAYSPGRSDALLVRHDAVDGDLNHVIATRNGTGYTIPGEKRLRNPGNEARPIGVADGYWVSYETGGTLEAAHVDFTGVVGTVVPLGPLGATTAHGTLVEGGEPYVVWLQDGLELAHLCP